MEKLISRLSFETQKMVIFRVPLFPLFDFNLVSLKEFRESYLVYELFAFKEVTSGWESGDWLMRPLLIEKLLFIIR